MPGESVKILAIDDNADNLLVIEAVVSESLPDAQIYTAASGEEGIALARSNDPDVILLDIVMPGKDGYAVCEELKQDQQLRGVPVIFLTALRTDQKSRIKALEAGAEGFLVKPPDPAELVAQIRAMAKIKEVNQQEKKSLREQYETLFREMLDGFALHEIICDQGRPIDYRFLDVNPAFERMTGLKRSEILGRTVLEILPETEPFWIETYGRVALTGEPADFENYAQELDKHFEVTAFRPAPNQFACIFADVTERKLMEEERQQLEGQLRQSQKLEALGTLAGGIAHDFNNLLQGILGYAHLAQQELTENSDGYFFLKQVEVGGKRAAQLVAQILTFSRTTQEDRYPIRLQNVLAEALDLLRPALPTTIEIREPIDNTVGAVVANPSQMHQVIMNLATNAKHAMRESGGVLELGLDTVEVKEGAVGLQPKRYARLTFKDSGTGIDADTLEHIFEPYFTTKEPGEGTGLGLSTVHGIIKSHGGAITVESEEGLGTKFIVLLPLAGASDEAEVSEQEVATEGREHLLLIDDDATLVRMCKMGLEQLGYTAEIFTNSRVALEAFRVDPDRFDLVVTDQTMPKLTGGELAREILTIRPSCPIILYTGFSETLTSEQARSLGIKSYLNKPISIHDLAAEIRSVLARD